MARNGHPFPGGRRSTKFGDLRRDPGLAALEARLGWPGVMVEGCRWIIGEPGKGRWQWCSAPCVVSGDAGREAWCAHHWPLVYTVGDYPELTDVPRRPGKRRGTPGSARNRQSIIQTGDLVVDLETRVVFAHGQPVRLTSKEFCILELLNLRKGTIVTKAMFLDRLYGGRDEPALKIIDVLVCHLRTKLAQATGGKHYIGTVRGGGYVLRDPAQIPPPPLLDTAATDLSA